MPKSVDHPEAPPADLAALFSNAYHSRPQDLRTLPPRAKISSSAPMFATMLVLVGWLAIGFQAALVVRLALQERTWQQAEALAVQNVSAAESSLNAERGRSDEARKAQEFMEANEALLAKVGDTNSIMKRILAAKPGNIRMTAFSLRRNLDAGSAEFGLWEVALTLRNDEKLPIVGIRDALMKALHDAGLSPRLLSRPSGDDPSVVNFAAVINPNAAGQVALAP